MSASKINRNFARVALSSLLLAGCGEMTMGPLWGPLSEPVSKITILSGGEQSVASGQGLTAPIVVRLDTANVPAAGIRLWFLVQNNSSTVPSHTWEAQTDSKGVASATGTVSNAVVGPAKIIIAHCYSASTACHPAEARATAAVNLTITAPATP